MGTVGGLIARPGPGLSWGSHEGGGDRRLKWPSPRRGLSFCILTVGSLGVACAAVFSRSSLAMSLHLQPTQRSVDGSLPLDLEPQDCPQRCTSSAIPTPPSERWPHVRRDLCPPAGLSWAQPLPAASVTPVAGVNQAGDAGWLEGSACGGPHSDRPSTACRWLDMTQHRIKKTPWPLLLSSFWQERKKKCIPK